MKRQGGLGRAARSQIVAGVFALTCATCLLVFADGQRAKEARVSARRDNPREPMAIEQAISIAENMLEGPMTVEQAKTMAENMLQSIVAVIHPADSPQVIGVPSSVAPTGSCVDGVCVNVVRSNREYLRLQPKGVHRFEFMTIASDSDDMLFAVITGGTIQTKSPSNEQIQQFFNAQDDQTATVTPYCTPEVFGWRACILIDDDEDAICAGVCNSTKCYTVCYAL